MADLDGSVSTRRNQWRASIATLVVDGNNRPVSGATVSGSWSDGRTASGKTNTRGSVNFPSAWLSSTTASIMLTVTNIVASGLTYTPAMNSDPDGDSELKQPVPVDRPVDVTPAKTATPVAGPSKQSEVVIPASTKQSAAPSQSVKPSLLKWNLALTHLLRKS